MPSQVQGFQLSDQRFGESGSLNIRNNCVFDFSFEKCSHFFPEFLNKDRGTFCSVVSKDSNPRKSKLESTNLFLAVIASLIN